MGDLNTPLLFCRAEVVVVKRLRGRKKEEMGKQSKENKPPCDGLFDCCECRQYIDNKTVHVDPCDKGWYIRSTYERCLFCFLKNECRLVPGKDFQIQYEVKGCPFNKNFKHKVDFFLPALDLYIEVKGSYTYYEINKLRWLDEHNHLKLFIFAYDNPDWGKESYRFEDDSSAREFVKKIMKEQFEDIKGLVENSKTVKDVVKNSKNRLADYLKNRTTRDFEYWENRLKSAGKNFK